MKRQKLLAILCVLTMLATLFAGCGSSGGQSSTAASPAAETGSAAQTQESLPQSSMPSNEVKPIVRVGALQGPTGLGLSSLMEKAEQKEAASIYNFTLAGAPDEISGKIISGELDIACVPTNLASVLYEKTQGGVSVISISTLGVLYVLQKNEEDAITGFADLSGKTIYTTGQGATQEYVLSYLLEQSGATDVTVEYKSEHAELATLVLEGQVEYALLPQPFVTTVTSKDEDVKIALDVTELWNTATGGKQLAMGCVIVRNDFLQTNQAAVDNFLREYTESVDFVNGNVEEGAALAGKFEIINEAVAKLAIPKCNIVCVTGEEMKNSVSAYLEILFAANPGSVGGSLPDEAFYYVP